VITGGESLVSHAGGVLLVETARRSGLSGQLRRLLGRWRLPLAIHDPGKIVTDLAIAVALGGDAACDVAVLRAPPGVFGPVASDPTVSRLITRLVADADDVLAALNRQSPVTVETSISGILLGDLPWPLLLVLVERRRPEPGARLAVGHPEGWP
jgi:hypothetical protein